MNKALENLLIDYYLIELKFLIIFVVILIGIFLTYQIGKWIIQIIRETRKGWDDE